MSEYIVDVNCSYFGIGCEPHESVVRCRDCIWFQDGYCMRPDGNGDYLRIGVEPDGFCAWAERIGE